jgi:hypothetical protein
VSGGKRISHVDVVCLILHPMHHVRRKVYHRPIYMLRHVTHLIHIDVDLLTINAGQSLPNAIISSSRRESRPRKSGQDDRWSFCLTAGTLCPSNQETR